MSCERRQPYVPSTTETGRDTGTVETGEVIQQETVECADPSLRDSLGPYERIELDVSLEAYDSLPDMTLASGISVGDLTGDGLLDIVVPQAGPSQLLVQQSDGSFVDETAERWSGLEAVMGASAAIIADVNGDGLLDVFTCSGIPLGPLPKNGLYNHLFLGTEAGGLERVSGEWGLEDEEEIRVCFGGSFGDVDGDGDLDMALATNLACPLDMETGEEDCEALLEQGTLQVLWENQGDGFVDVSEQLSRDEILASFMHVASLIDVDGDHDVDLYITNDKKNNIPFASPNLLFSNDASALNLDEGLHGLDITIPGMGLGVADINGDALPDFLVTGTQRVALLTSTEGFGWADTAAARGLVFTKASHIEAWAAEMVDVDNDGDLDIPIIFGYLSGSPSDKYLFEQPDVLFLNTDDGFMDIAADISFDDRGIGRGMVVADINGDGWLDIIKRELGGKAIYYRSRCGEAAWSQIHLRQDGANPFAVGAVVMVRTGDTEQRRWVLGGGTSFASNAAVGPHFGLGDAEVIDEIIVTWPDGSETRFVDQPVRTPLVLSRPQ